MLALKNGGLAFLGVFGYVAFLSRKGINSMVLARSSLHLSSGEDEDFIRPGDQVHHRTGMSPGEHLRFGGS